MNPARIIAQLFHIRAARPDEMQQIMQGYELLRVLYRGIPNIAFFGHARLKQLLFTSVCLVPF
jgi:hypothetical protein